MNSTSSNANSTSSSKLMSSLSALSNDKKWSLNSMQTSTTPSQGLRKFGTISSTSTISSPSKTSSSQPSSLNDKTNSSVDHHFILNG
jgi:hypothetical protein